MLLPVLLALAQAPVTDAAPKPIESLPPLVGDAQTISPDHTRIAISTENEGVWVLDIVSKSVVQRVPSSPSPVKRIAWKSDGAAFAMLHLDQTIDVVDAVTGEVRTSLHPPGTSLVRWNLREIHFAAGDTVIVVALGGPPTDIMSVATGTSIARISTGNESVATAMALSRDGEVLAQGDGAGVVTFWNARTGKRLEGEAKISNDDRFRGTSHWEGYRGIHSLDFDPTGHLLTIGGGDCAAYLWCRTQQRVVRTFSHCDLEVFNNLGIGSVAFSPDGSRLLTTSFSYWGVRVWDLSSDQLLDHFEIDDRGIPFGAWFSTDGTRIVGAADLTSATFDASHPLQRSTAPESFAKRLPCPPPSRMVSWKHYGDYAWAVVDHDLVVRKIRDEQPILKIPVRERQRPSR